MESIIIPQSKIKLFPVINSGAHGKCVKFNDEIVVKLWHSSPTVSKEHLKNFFNLNDNFFKFARGFTLDENENYIGYFMSYAKGVRIQEIPEETLLYDIMSAYIDSLNGFNYISNECLSVYDLSEDNIIFNGNFSFIDTDSYEFLDKTNKNSKLCSRENLFEYVNTLFLFFISQNSKIMELIYSDSDLNDMYINYQLGYAFSFDLFMEIFINRLNKKTGSFIETVKDLKEIQYIYSKR